MRNVALVIIIALLLPIQAFAAGNYIMQSNSQQSNGAIYQSSSNTATVIGDNNYINQNNLLSSSGAQYPEHVSQDAVNSIIVEGDLNNATQSNNAWTGMFGEFADITQIQRNIGAITGIGNGMNQNNYADIQNNGNDNVVHQTEENLAAISGNGDMSDQSNYQYASPDEASPMLLGEEFSEEETDIIEQVAMNDVVMTGGYDRSWQNNSQNAFQEIDTDTYLNQTASNYNVVTSSVDWLPCV